MSLPTPLTATVITVSDRVSQGTATDTSGPLASKLLSGVGISPTRVVVVSDDIAEISTAVRTATVRSDVVVLTGGTGLGPRDVTPEAVLPLLDRHLPGIGEAIRAASRETVPTADLSRVLAGSMGRSFVVALPGSPGGVRDGLSVALPLIPHAISMIRGENHDAGAGSVSGVAEISGGAPVSGFEPPLVKGRVVIARVTAEPLSVVAHESAVNDPTAGAVVSFNGVVRDHDAGRAVTALDYEAHPSAQSVLAEVAAEIAAMPGVVAVAVSHRHGPLVIGDVALAAAVSSAHRAEAFAACARLVDAVKERIPVWKRQIFLDGTDEWVNSA